MFQRHPDNPTIPRTPGTFYGIFSANPDLLLFNGKYHFYFRGQGDEGHDQMGVAYATPETFDGVRWEMAPENPIIKVGADPDDFDSAHVLGRGRRGGGEDGQHGDGGEEAAHRKVLYSKSGAQIEMPAMATVEWKSVESPRTSSTCM